eukprot:4561144-Prymnesium_polylepis.2
MSTAAVAAAAAAAGAAARGQMECRAARVRCGLQGTGDDRVVDPPELQQWEGELMRVQSVGSGG